MKRLTRISHAENETEIIITKLVNNNLPEILCYVRTDSVNETSASDCGMMHFLYSERYQLPSTIINIDEDQSRNHYRLVYPADNRI